MSWRGIVYWNVFDYSETAKRQRAISAVAMDPVFDHAAFRFGNDGSEAAHTWVDAQDADVTLDVDTTYVVRFAINNTGTGNGNIAPKLQYYHVEGTATWTDVNASSSVIRSTASGSITDDEVTTTGRMTGGTGTWEAGYCDEADGTFTSTIALNNGNWADWLWVFQVRSADVSNNDTINLRAVEGDGTVLANWTGSAAQLAGITADFGGTVYQNTVDTADGTSTTAVDVGAIRGLGGSQADGVGATTVDVGAIRELWDGDSRLSLPGESGDYASRPGGSDLNLSSNELDVQVLAEPDDWSPATTHAVACVWDSAPSDYRDWRFQIQTNGNWAVSGWDGAASYFLQSSAPGISSGRQWMRVVFDANDGAGNHVATFYKGGSGDTPSWTQINAPSNTGTFTFRNSTSQPLEIGSRETGVQDLFAGKIYRVIVRDGQDGTILFDADFTKEAPGTTSFTEDSSNAATVTINQSGSPQAEIVRDALRVEGKATTTADLEIAAGGTVYELTVDTADGVGATTVTTSVIANRLASADGTSSTTVAASVIATRIAQADGTSTTAVDLAVVRGLGGVSADGLATTVLDVATLYALAASADGVGSSTISRINTGDSVLSLPGEASDNASADDSAALDITGDIDVRAKLALNDWTPGALAAVVSKFRTSGADERSYQLGINASNNLAFNWSTDGTSGTAVFQSKAFDTQPTDNDTIWIRATLDVDNGASGYDLDFYISTDDGETWDQQGTTTVGGSTTSIHSGSATLYIGSQENGAFGSFAGYVHRVQIRNGIGGTVVFDADFTRENPGTTSFKESSSNGATVTVNQSGDPQAEIILAPTIVNLTAQADGVATTQSDLTVPTVYTFTASADGVATADSSDLFRRIVVASEGALQGSGFVTAFFAVGPPAENVAQADGVGTAAATLYRRVILGYNSEASGAGSTTASFAAPVQYSLTAQADGVATTAVDLAVIASRVAQADGVATTTVSIQVGGTFELTASADGVATTAVDLAVIASRVAQSDGVATTAVSLSVKRALVAQADGAGVTAVGQTYYVSNTGSDSDNGLTEGTAWQTISKVNGEAFNPNDRILFERDGVWREKLVVPSSGGSGAHVTVDAYGSGADPIITGADDMLTASYQWTASGSGTNEYYVEASGGGNPGLVDPKQIFLDGTRATIGTAGTLADHEWDWADNDTLGFSTIYLRDDSGDPDTSGVTIEASQRDYGINVTNKEYVTVQNVQVIRAYTYGLYFANSNQDAGWDGYNWCYDTVATDNWRSGFRADNVENLIFQRLTVTGSGASGISTFATHSTTRGQNGLVANCIAHTNCQLDDIDWTAGIKHNSSGADNCIWEDNVSYNNGYSGQPGSRGAGFWIDGAGENPIVRRNHVYDNEHHGLFVEVNYGTVGPEVYYNLVHGNGETGLCFTAAINIGVKNYEVYNNVSYGNSKGMWVRGDGATASSVINNTFRNNILFDNTTYELDCENGGENDGTYGSGNVYTHNCLGVEATAFVRWGTGTTYNTYDAWETGYGATTSSVEADPQLLDAPNDLRPLTGSGVLDAGIDVGLTTDYAGYAVSDPPSIGAYEGDTGFPLLPTADGVGTTAVDLAVIRSAAAQADGVATTTVALEAGAVETVTAAADGVAATTVDLAVVRALGATQADGVAATTVALATLAEIELTASADGVASTTSQTLRLAHRDTQATGTSSTTVQLQVIASRSVQADGTSTVTVDMAALRELVSLAEGAATVALAMTAPASALLAVEGKYAKEHAQAYLDVSAVEGTLGGDYADAYVDVLKAGI